MAKSIRTEHLYDLSHTLAAPFLAVCRYPFEILPHLSEAIGSLPYFLCRLGYRERGLLQYVHPTAAISERARLEGVAVIGPHCEVGDGAVLGGVLVGEGCRIGNGTTLTHSILFDEARVQGGCLVDGAVIGYRASLGAGSRTLYREGEREGWWGGVFLGDGAAVGRGSSLLPGSILCRGATVPPASAVCGRVECGA